MKTNLLTLFIAGGIYFASWAQIAQKPLTFTSVNKYSKSYVMATAATNTKQTYAVDLQTFFTSIMIKVPIQSNLISTYVVSNGDTLHFKKSAKQNEPVSTSQLVIFKTPVKSFLFYSGALNDYVEFHLYNSQPNEGHHNLTRAKSQEHNENTHHSNEDVHATAFQSLENAQVAVLSRNDSNLSRHQNLHSNTTLIRHPDYLKKKRKEEFKVSY